jgi:hypothetical protein
VCTGPQISIARRENTLVQPRERVPLQVNGHLLLPANSDQALIENSRINRIVATVELTGVKIMSASFETWESPSITIPNTKDGLDSEAAAKAFLETTYNNGSLQNLRTNPRHHLENGAVAGVGVSIGQYGLDQLMRSTRPEIRPEWSSWTPKNYSPATATQSAFTGRQAGVIGLGALGGALIGSKLDNDDPGHGALIGGLAGTAVAGTLSGAIKSSLIGKGLGVGMIVAGGQLAVNTGLNYALGGDLQIENKTSYGISALAVPAILLSPMSTPKKVFATVSSLAMSGAFDKFAGEPSARFNEWLRPNWADAALGVTAAFMPGGWQSKAGAFAAAWLAGRVYGGAIAPMFDSQEHQK